VVAIEEGRVGLFPYNPDYQVQIGWDLGHDDDTVMWFFQVINGKIYFIDVICEHGRDLDWYCDEMTMEHRAEWQYQRMHLPHDAKSKKFGQVRSAIEQMAYDRKLPCKLIPKMSLLDQHSQTRREFPKMHFNEAPCGVGIEGIKLYRQTYDRELKKYRDKPVHDWTSHYASALHSSVFGYEPSRTNTNGSIIIAPTRTFDDAWKMHDQMHERRAASARRI